MPGTADVRGRDAGLSNPGAGDSLKKEKHND